MSAADPQFVQDYLDLPELISRDQFVAKVTEEDEDKIVQQVRQYVLPEPIEPLLDGLLRDIAAAKKENKPLGRWLFGSFGCGKSHLMAMLGLMLENDDRLWDNTDEEGIRKLQDNHSELIKNDDVLVVRLNMMEQPELRVAFYEAFNEAMAERDLPTYPFVDLQQGVRIVREQGERFGLDEVERQLREEGMLRPSQDLEEILANFDKQSRTQKLEFTKNILQWHMPGNPFTGTDEEDYVGTEGQRAKMARKAQYLKLYMGFNEGLDAMADHAYEHGFRSITLLLDEFIIWARGLQARAYAREMNAMSALVDAQGGSRKVSFAVIAAIQREFFRQFDVEDQGELREDLKFVQDRFERLEMVDTALHEVAKRRVLKPKEGLEQEFGRAREDALNEHADVKKALALDGPTREVEALVPFHPALIRVLVDVTQGLNRSRGALEVLYDLLVNQMEELEVGEFVPLGVVFDSLFKPEMVSSIKESPGEMQRKMYAHYDTYKRLLPQMREVCGLEAKDEATPQFKNLDLLVKSVLLLQLSYRRNDPDEGQEPWEVTSELLYRLNTHEIESFTPRGAYRQIEELLRKLSAQSGLVYVDQADPARIRIETESVDTDEIIRDAEARVTYADMERDFSALLRDELSGISFGTSQAVKYRCAWRGRRMRGLVEMRNVRKIPYSSSNNEFAPDSGEAFRFFVDYPFDTEGYTREDDVNKFQRARADRGTSPTAAWLPTHLSSEERDQLKRLAAINRIEREPESFWDEYSARERQTLEDQLANQKMGVRKRLLGAIRKHYVEQAGQVEDIIAFMDDLSAPNLDSTIKSQASLADIPDLVIREILNSRYPEHPDFDRNESRKKFDHLARLFGRAVGNTSGRTDLDSSEEKVVREYGRPLELFDVGDGAATVKRDGRYLKALDEVHSDNAGRLRVADLRDKLTEEPYGLSDDCAAVVIQAFALTRTYRMTRNARETDGSVSIESVRDISDSYSLVPGELADPHDLQSAQELAEDLFGRSFGGRREQLSLATMQTRSLTQQDRFADSVRKHANAAVELIEDIEATTRKLLQALGVSPDASNRLDELAEARVWLESFGTVNDSLAVIERLSAPTPDQQQSIDALKSFCGALPEEREHVDTLGTHRDKLKALSTHGSTEAWTELHQELSDLLRDRTSKRKLAGRVAKLKAAIKERYQEEVVGSDPPPPPEGSWEIENAQGNASEEAMGFEADVAVEGDAVSMDVLLSELAKQGELSEVMRRELANGRWRARLTVEKTAETAGEDHESD